MDYSETSFEISCVWEFIVMSDFFKVYFVKKSVLSSNIHMGCYIWYQSI